MRHVPRVTPKKQSLLGPPTGRTAGTIGERQLSVGQLTGQILRKKTR